MEIRFGTYTLYQETILALIENPDSYRLVKRNCTNNDNTFIKYTENIFYKDVLKKEINNAFFIKTKCLYKKNEFDLQSIENNIALIVTDDKNAFNELNLELRDRGVYQLSVNKSDLEKVWEVRSKSSLQLPFPMNLKIIEELDVP
jgi:hypothetical protein